MSIRVRCAQCAKQFSAPDQYAGCQATCPNCGNLLQIPGPPTSDYQISGESGSGLGTGPLSGRNDLRHRVKVWIYRHGPVRYLATNKLLVAVMGIGFLWLIEAIATSRIGVGLGAAFMAALIAGIGFFPRSPSTEKTWIRILAIIASVNFLIIALVMAIGAWQACKASPNQVSAFLMWLVVFVAVLVAAFLLLVLLCYLVKRAGFFQVFAWGYVVLFGVFPLFSIPTPLEQGRGAWTSMQAINKSLATTLAETCGPTVRHISRKPSSPLPSPKGSEAIAVANKGPGVPTPRQDTREKPETVPSAPEQVSETSAKPASTPWTAGPDPLPVFEEVTARGPIVLHCALGSIRQVVFCPEAMRVVVMSSQTGFVGNRPAATSCRVDVHDLKSGDHLRRCALSDKSILADVSADGELALVLQAGHAEVWSLETTDRQQRWEFTNPTEGGELWAAFVDDTHVLTLNASQRLTLWQLPEQKEVYTVEDVRGASVSPGRKYVVTLEPQFESGMARVRDAATGKCCGDVVSPAGRKSISGTISVAFSPDGSKVAVAQRESIVLWSMQEGKQLWEVSLRMPKQPPLFLGSEYLLAGPLGDEGALIDIKRGAVVWRYGFRLSGVRWNDMIHRNYTGKLWVLAAEDSGITDLTTIGIPGARVRAELASQSTSWSQDPGVTEITREEFLGNATVAELPKGKALQAGGKWQPSGTGFGISSIADWGTQRAQEAASLAYVTKTYSDLLAGDDGTLLDRLQWFPAAGRPTIGLRWGLGVQVTGQNEQPQVDSTSDLVKLTGVIGPYLGTRLFQRVANREFGYWPDRGLSDLQEVALLGSGTHADLLAAARRQGLDVVMVVTIRPHPGTSGLEGGATLRFRFVDVSDGKPLWNSSSLNTSQIGAAGRVGNPPDAELASEILKYVDDHFRLQPMPELTGPFVQQRLAKLSEVVKDAQSNRQTVNLLAAMLEIRYYFLKHQVPPDEVVRLYELILRNGKGEVLARGDQSHRHQVLEDWLTHTL